MDDETPSKEAETGAWKSIATFTLPSEPGNEKIAMQKVSVTAQAHAFPVARLDQLKTAVAEATMNAMEHGNDFDPDKRVEIEVFTLPNAIKVQIRDQGTGQPVPDHTEPDLDAKLAGLQSPRGWGLFLIRSMVDELRLLSDDQHHTIELIFYLLKA